MHTIGHFGSHEMVSSVHGQAVVDSEHALPISAGSGQGVTSTPNEPALPLGSIAVCVAILCGLTVLVVAALLAARAGTWQRHMRALPDRVTLPARGPPGAPIGLLLADLAVARN